MKEITLEQLAPYLPYGLKMIFESKGGRIIELMNITNSKLGVYFSDGYGAMNLKHSGFKPILRPLTDLTKEIEVNGTETYLDLINKNLNENPECDCEISYDTHENFYVIKCYSGKVYGWELNIIQYELLKLHFNIFDLDESQYIDINTLDKK